MALSLRTGAFSDIGRTRKKNDDSGYAGTHFVMVADGMGGAPAGDLASAVAVQTMQRLDAPAPDDLLQALAGAVHRANDRLTELIEEDPSVEGMGTTVTAVLFVGDQIGIAHLGDSRGYLWRDGELIPLTSDHTWVQSLIDEGRITEDEAKTHSHRSLLLKVLDGRHDNEPDLSVFDVRPGDRILLCSDGLSGFVELDRIAEALSAGEAQEVSRELTQLALDSHSTDNVTVVVADVVDEPMSDTFVPLVVGSAAEETPGRIGRIRSWAQRDHVDRNEALVDAELDPEERRYAPREPGRFRWLKRVLVLGAVLALVAVIGIYSYSWSQEQYYVGEHDGQVAIFQGVQEDLPGIDLNSVYRVEDISLDSLPSFRRSQVIEGMTAGDLDDAERIVSQLETFADQCAGQVAESSPSPTRTSPRPSGGNSAPDASAPTRGQGSGGTDRPITPDRSGSTQRPATQRPTTLVSPDASATADGQQDAEDECAGVSPESETGS